MKEERKERRKNKERERDKKREGERAHTMLQRPKNSKFLRHHGLHRLKIELKERRQEGEMTRGGKD